jgi:hypothetical protein
MSGEEEGIVDEVGYLPSILPQFACLAEHNMYVKSWQLL